MTNSIKKAKAVEIKGNICNRCNTVYEQVCYDFHHINPNEKTFSIGSNTKGWKDIEKELEKCIMLCANCHRIIHAKKTVSNNSIKKAKAVKIKNNICYACKNSYEQECYDFHHINPKLKSFSIGDNSKGWKDIEQELEKCVMLCANCHRLVHAGKIKI